MKVIVIGLGSMGKRRIRLLRQIDKNIQIYGVDINLARREEVRDKYGVVAFPTLDDVPSAECAFVCAPPLAHAKIIRSCLERGLNTFSELNLVSENYDENIKLAEENQLVLFLSSTFLYKEEIQFIRARVMEQKKKVSYVYHIGQYLPDWHPWECYKNSFISNKGSNACREIMAIEIPWLQYVFGKVKSYYVVSQKMTNLEIKYPDCFMILFKHESGSYGILILDVVSRKALRNFECFGEDLYLSWDGSPEGLFQYDIDQKKDRNIKLYKIVDRQEGYSNFVVENAYLKEIEAFFEEIRTGKKPIYDFGKDKSVLALIDSLENAGASNV